jgi:alkaline phosphatase D
VTTPFERIGRRAFVRRALGTGLGSLVAARTPAIIRAQASRPATDQGVACGAMGGGRALIWSRSDRPARLFVEYSTTDAFTDVRQVRGPAALPVSDFTARAMLTGLPDGQRIFYRVRFQDLSDLRAWSEPVTGSFVTPESKPTRDLKIAWSADTVGQGWGINADFGGMRLYETMLRAGPDVFIHCGDTIYADAPLRPEVPLDDGSVWRNVVTEAKSSVAQSLDDYRGNYLYNLQDAHMRRFNSAVGQVVLWDDHEVRDNWYETRDLSKDARYQEKSMALLAARARQAFFEFNPLPVDGVELERHYRTVPCGPLAEIFVLDLRSYRGPNSGNLQTTLTDESRLLGTAQVEWLQRSLRASKAVWKIIACSMPIGLVVPDGPSNFEAIANGDPGVPRGREQELAVVLKFIHDQRIRNVVWVTGDVHYCAAHHYDPARARFTEFDPFWEFVAGPLHAGTFGPNPLDPTFGPEVRFMGIPQGMKPNRPPSAGLQFFGMITVNAKTRAMTVTLHDLSGRAIYRVELPPES